MTTITKETNPRDLFNLLESNEFEVVDQIVKLINENLNKRLPATAARESWLLGGLVDYYFLSESATARDIIVTVRDPHDKHLMDKLSESMKNSETRLMASRLLLYVVCKQPSWLHKLVSSALFAQVIKCLKNDGDVAILATCSLIVTNYLPVQPATIGLQYMSDLCEILSRLINTCLTTNGQASGVCTLYLHSTVYSLFHRLYSLYPCNLLAYLRQHYNKKENIAAYEEAVKPMLDRVRLHPRLITGSKESEMNSTRWKKMEVQDIVVDCNHMSLDVIEGSGEIGQCPDLTSRWNPRQRLKCNIVPVTPLHHTKGFVMDAADSGLDQTSALWSPSVICGLSTPPPPQLTPSQVTSQHDTSGHLHPSAQSTFSSTPAENTPRATPIDDMFDKSILSRNHSRASIPRHPSGGSNTSSRLVTNTSATCIDASSLPPSPLKPCFTSDPPAGTRRSHLCNAAHELDFGASMETSCDRSSALKDKLQSVRSESGVEARSSQVTRDTTDSLQAIDAIVDLLGTHDNVDLVDQEVSDLTKDHLDASLDASTSSDDEKTQQTTAASVKQFMKSVNRIRFNSLTMTGSELRGARRLGLRKKFSSCPQLETLTAENEDGDDNDVIRSSSMMVQPDSSVADALASTDSPTTTSIVPQTHRVLIKSTSKGALLDTIAEPPQGSDGSGETPTSPQYAGPAIPASEAAETSVCSRCLSSYPSDQPVQPTSQPMPDPETPFFNAISPPELLDRHLQLGGDAHIKELSQIPMTSGQTVNWTHFGGVAPADEVNILHTQLTLLQNQLLYERHKRVLHAQRNRRLLHKIIHAKSIEEDSVVMADQLKQQENEIHNLQVSQKLLHEQNEELYRSQENGERNKQMRLQQQEIESLRYGQKELQTMIVNQKKENDLLKQRLQESQHDLFDGRAEIDTLREKASVTNELREQITCLNKELLLKGEIHQRYQEQMTAKLKHQARPENEYLVKSLRLDIAHLKVQLEQTDVQASADHNRLTDLEENIKVKEQVVAELKKRLEHMKMSRHDEIAAVEAKYNSLMKINQQLESYILDLYSRLDHAPSTNDPDPSSHRGACVLRPPPSPHDPVAASPVLPRSHSDSPPSLEPPKHSGSSSLDALSSPASRERRKNSGMPRPLDFPNIGAGNVANRTGTARTNTSSTLSDSGSVMY